MRRILFLWGSFSLALLLGGCGSSPGGSGSGDGGADDATTAGDGSGTGEAGFVGDGSSSGGPDGSSSGDGSSSSGGDAAPSVFTIGGTVTGLAGTGLTLTNGTQTLAVSANGAFTFPTALAAGTLYSVAVGTQPSAPTQKCTISNASGTVGSANVSNITVACVTSAFTVGGTVTGLAGKGLVLEDNNGDDLSVTMNGTFTFATPVDSGSSFNVTVKTQPSSPQQTCTVTGGTGKVGSAKVTSVTVNCATGTYAVGGQITGLNGTVVLQDNGGDNLTVTSNGTFAFPTPVVIGNPYAVTVLTQPGSPAQTCVVTNGTGTITNAAITSVQVTCTTNKYTIGGTVTGLAGTGLVLQDNAGDNLTVTANGTFTFATSVASGAAYAVTVLTQPTTPSQTCVLTHATGTVGNANVTNVALACTTNTYAIGGTLTGLAASDSIVLQDNGGDNLTLNANGTFAFPTALASGATYAVTVLTQPGAPVQTCTVSGGTGSVVAGAVKSVTVNCATNTYTVGGTISGLAGTVVLQDNGGDNLTLTTNGSFAFATPVASGMSYAVTVHTQPGTPSQSCVVASGTGEVTNSNVTSVTVTCTTNAFKVGGTVSGLASGETVVLQDNGADNLTVSANGTFTFATSVLSGATYAATVLTNPASPLTQTCAVTNGTGTIAGANVTNVTVTCTTNTYTIGGMVSGLVGTGLILTDNGGDSLPVSSNGSFTFATPVASGGTYAVAVAQNPTSPSQTCVVGSGSGPVTNAAITSVTITCTTNSYTVGGTVTGLAAGDSLVLEDNSGDDLSVTASGSFTFVTPVASGAGYAVTIFSTSGATAQTCTVSAGTGTVGGGNVTTVAINCMTNSYTIGGTVSGLSGTGLVLQDNGGDNLPISANGNFAFATPIASGATYAATVMTSPSAPTQTCVVTNGTGTVGSANVTTVTVTCTTNTYTIGGTLSGLAATDTVVLQDNGANNLTLSANGAFTFTTSISSGSTYAVSVLTNPASPSQNCVVTAGSGTVTNANVTSVIVTCTTDTCSAQTINSCTLTTTNSGSTDTGTCVSGDFGSCSYSCNLGTWTQVTNTCAPGTCATVSGVLWCMDTTPGRSCDTLCTALGYGNPTIAAATWFADQDTQAECTQIGAAFGLTFNSIAGYTYACAETAGGQILCSNYSGCPTQHLTLSDSAPYTAICPCH